MSLLSTRAERHAAIVGLGAGFTAALTGRVELLAVVVAISIGVRAAPEPGKLRELRREPWYAIGFGLVGYASVTVAPKVVAAVAGVV